VPSKIRWCLTGTPIQNSLDDLGALVRFLKVPVLDNLALYRKHITTPVVANVSGRFANLRRLLEALCLRRTKALLDLPEPATDTQLLKLSAIEAAMYHDFADLCKHTIDLAVSGHSMKKANQEVIQVSTRASSLQIRQLMKSCQAILGMRLFCNDGEQALMKRMNSNGLPTDPDQVLSYLQTSSRSTCVQCGTDITTMYQEDDASSGRLTICQHLICGECLVAYEDDLDNNLEDGRTQCPVCGLRGARDAFVVDTKSATKQHAKIANSKLPTKLLALLHNVKAQSINDKW
jgi:SWI/SNF-related matrix-associated actin-dependent regulator of chromatin subfamily A3